MTITKQTASLLALLLLSGCVLDPHYTTPFNNIEQLCLDEVATTARIREGGGGAAYRLSAFEIEWRLRDCVDRETARVMAEGDRICLMPGGADRDRALQEFKKKHGFKNC